MSLTPVPSLDELAADPGKVTGLPPATVMALLARCAVAQSALTARLLASPTPSPDRSEPPADDRLLTPEQAAATLGVTPRWLYRHAPRLPFTRRLSRKALRFSEAGLRRWQATKRA